MSDSPNSSNLNNSKHKSIPQDETEGAVFLVSEQQQSVVSEDSSTITSNSDSSKACRVCMTKEDINRSIFDPIDEETTVMSSLMLCAFPLEISKTDTFPKQICNSCFATLKVAHKFRKTCLETDENLHKNQYCYNRVRKRQIADVEIAETSNKKACSQKDDNEIGQNDLDSLEQNLKRIHGEDVIKVKHVQGGFKEEPSENILGAIENSCKPKSSSEKFTINKIIKDGATSKTIIVKQSSSSSTSQVVVLPEHIQVKVASKIKTRIGRFPFIEKRGFCNASIILAGGYVFEVKLTKQNMRMLKCITPSCPSYAEQTILDCSILDNHINVKVSHNHVQPNEQSIKRQIFFNKVKRKMLTDRFQNVRSIYEDACTKMPDIKTLIPLHAFIKEVCKEQLVVKVPTVGSFEEFYNKIESDSFANIHFTNNGQQFYRERFATEDGALGVVFANKNTLENISLSKHMYIDASFQIDTNEDFKYQLVTVLIWVDDSYYPILYGLITHKTQEIFKLLFEYLHDQLAPDLRPDEIITDYDACLYYAIAEVYTEASIGGSVFYYTQNLYKKICSLNLSKDLETNAHFRSIYHMLLMLPLLPVNTIQDGLNNIEIQARDKGVEELSKPLFDYFKSQWMLNVTPLLFCVHRLENRINETVVAPFKKLRDYLLLTKGKMQKTKLSVGVVVEKLIELEAFLFKVYSKNDKKSFGRDLSGFQKKNVLKAWQYIENHPKINIETFFAKVNGYIKCMENQLWIWGFYRYTGDVDEVLINASNFMITDSVEDENSGNENVLVVNGGQEHNEHDQVHNEQANEIDSADNVTAENLIENEANFDENMTTVDVNNDEQQTVVCEETIDSNQVVMEAVVDQDGTVVLQTAENGQCVADVNKHFEGAFLNYVYQ